MQAASTPRYRDRRQAGRVLAKLLASHAANPGLLVLGLPRGGVPVAFEVARALHAPLDVMVVRKLGAPDQEELAMGAIACGEVRVLDQALLAELQVTDAQLNTAIALARDELARRERLYRGHRPPLDVRGHTVILVDDGLATGCTMRAAARAVRHLAPARLLIAVPVASQNTCEALRAEADDIVCAAMPSPFRAVGLWYDNFEQTTDDEVLGLLKRSQEGSP